MMETQAQMWTKIALPSCWIPVGGEGSIYTVVQKKAGLWIPGCQEARIVLTSYDDNGEDMGAQTEVKDILIGVRSMMGCIRDRMVFTEAPLSIPLFDIVLAEAAKQGNPWPCDYIGGGHHLTVIFANKSDRPVSVCGAMIAIQLQEEPPA